MGRVQLRQVGGPWRSRDGPPWVRPFGLGGGRLLVEVDQRMIHITLEQRVRRRGGIGQRPADVAGAGGAHFGAIEGNQGQQQIALGGEVVIDCARGEFGPFGDLLDAGCGTGNFLLAAQATGFQVCGTELDPGAIRFIQTSLGIEEVFPLTITGFAAANPARKFSVVTSFEVLEHQVDPIAFLRAIRSCLAPRGYFALSVPNRNRWLTGPDVLDYPPNHFLRWNESALRNALQRFGLQIISVRQQPVDFSYAVSMINVALRSGLTKKVTGSEDVFFLDVMQMDAAKAAAVIQAAPSARQRLMATLGKVKRGLCYPLAAAALPYLRFRGYKAAYLYCLAQKVEAPGISA